MPVPTHSAHTSPGEPSAGTESALLERDLQHALHVVLGGIHDLGERRPLGIGAAAELHLLEDQPDQLEQRGRPLRRAARVGVR